MALSTPSLIVITGPTAVGKTTLAIKIAKSLDAEIISADSQLFYKEINIGVAKPTQAEMDVIPHHLINVTDLSHPWSIAVFKERTYDLIVEISQRGKVPMLVGGSGQYIKSVVENWSIPEFDKDEKLRDAITHWGKEIGAYALYEKLTMIDSKAAQNIEYRNMRRSVRALEVIFSTGELFSAQRTKKSPPFAVTMVGISMEREMLYQKIDARINLMLKTGLVEEVEALIAKGYRDMLLKSAPIGYPEITRYLLGEISLDEAVVLMKRKTRILVRRQANWFKMEDPEIRWFTQSDDAAEAVISYLQQ